MAINYQRDILRAIAVVFSGATVAQALPILALLIAAQMIGPASFGVFAAWLAVVSVLIVILSGRYEMAIAIEKDESARATAAITTIGVAFVASLLIGVSLLLVWSISGIQIPLIGWWGVGTALIAAFGYSGIQTIQFEVAAEGEYRALTQMRITHAAILSGFQISGAILTQSAEGLIGGTTCGMVTTVSGLLIWRAYRKGAGAVPAQAISFLRRRARFPMYALPADMINTATASLPIFLFTIRFGPESAGLFAIVQRLIGGPIGLIGKSVLDVFRRLAAEALRKRGNCLNEYKIVFRILFAISTIIGVTLYLLGPQVFDYLLDEEWSGSRDILLIMIPVYMLSLVASTLGNVPYLVDRTEVDLYWQCALAVVVTLSLVTFEGFVGTVFAYAVGYGVMYLGYLAISYRLAASTRLYENVTTDRE